MSWLKVTTAYTLVAALAFAAIFAVTPTTYAQPAYTINYQGKLTDATGLAVADGDYDMEFRLYTVSSGGSAVWTETRTGGNQVSVVNGLFSVMLGDVTSLSSVDFNQPLWLGVNIESDGEMTPRKALGTVPSAFEAQRVGGVASSSFLRSDESDTASGLLTFTGGIISTASSTINNLTTDIATTTTLVINGEAFTDLTGAGLLNNSGVLTIDTAFLDPRYASTTDFDTSAELAAILGDETGTGSVVFSNSPTFTGTVSGAAASFSGNISAGSFTENGSTLSSQYFKQGGNSFATLATLGTNDANGLTFETNNTRRMTIDTSGNVGVGTTTPGAKLDVAGGIRLSAASIETAYHTGLQRLSGGESVLWYGGGSGDLYFKTGATGSSGDRMTLTSGGNLGIGTTSPTQRLHIASVGNVTALIDSGTTAVPSLNFAQAGTRRAFLRYQNAGQFDIINEYGALGFYTGTGGSEAQRMTIDASGNVGIGTTDPDDRLSVDGNISLAGTAQSIYARGGNVATALNFDFPEVTTANPLVRFFRGTNSTGGTRAIQIFAGDGTANENARIAGNTTNSFFNALGGNVGIGTNNPNTFKLQVAGNVGPETDSAYNLGSTGVRWANIYADSLDATSITENGSTLSSQYFKQGGNSFGSLATLGTNDSNDLTFETNNTRRLTIDTSGNVGIGTTTPSSKFHVFAAGGQSGLLVSGPESYAGTSGTVLRLKGFFDYSGAELGLYTDNTGSSRITTATSQSLSLGTNNTERLTITSGGNVGVGTTTPSARLSVYDDASSDKLFEISSSNTSDAKFVVNRAPRAGFGGNNTLFDFSGTIVEDDPALSLDFGSTFDFAPSATTNDWQAAQLVRLQDGYTGSGRTFGLIVNNYTNPQDTAYGISVSVDGGSGVGGNTLRNSIGTWSMAKDAREMSVGVVGDASPTTNPGGYRIGTAGFAGSASDVLVGGYFGLLDSFNSTASSSFAAMATSSALVATNGTFGNNIFTAYDNTTPVFNIVDGGNVGIGTTAPAAKLDIVGSELLLGADLGTPTTRTSGSTKFQGLVTPHRLSTEENVMALSTLNFSVGNNVLIGGGSANHNAATTISFYTGANNTTLTGTERLTINSAGNVGIGTTTPLGKLHVEGSAGGVYIPTAGNKLIFTRDGGPSEIEALGTSGALNIEATNYIAFNTGGSENLRMLSSGNVGIGTSPSTFKLQVAGNVGPDADSTYNLGSTGVRWANIYTDNLDATSITENGSTLSSQYFKQGGNSFGSLATLGTNDANVLTFETNNTRRMTIDTSGNVGIGTTTPLSKLEVYSTTGSQIRVTGANYEAGVVNAGDIFTVGSWNNASNRINLNLATGNVGIGETAPGSKLAVSGGASIGAGYDTTLAPTNGLIVEGNVGIGDNNPGNKLDVAGSINIANGNAYRMNDVDIVKHNSTSKSVSLGEGAGNLFNATGLYNTAVGYQAGFNAGTTTSSDFLTAIGIQAGYENTGSDVVAVGYRAGYLNSGANLTAIGPSAANNNTGTNVTAFGVNAGRDNTGTAAIAVGVNAGYGNAGANAIGIGFGAAYQNTGSNITALGYQAAYQNTSNSLVAVGYDAFRYRNAVDSVAIGFRAGYGSDTTRRSISRSTFLGYQAGYGITTGNNNLLLGYQAGDALTSGSNNIAIGYDVDLPSATGSNQLNIGNAIYGNLSTGNVGIGTTDPATKLSVAGDVTVGAGGTGGTGVQLILNGGSGTNGGGYLRFNKNGVTTGFIGQDSVILGGTSNDLSLSAGSGIRLYSGGSERLRVLSSGNVGIGTTNPSEKLEIYTGTGSIYQKIRTQDAGSTASPLEIGIKFSGFNDYQKAKIVATERSSNTFGSDLLFFTNGGNSSTDLVERLRVDNTGNVGIGTTSPSSLLETYKAAADNTLKVTVGDSGTTYSPKLTLSRVGATDWSLSQPAGAYDFTIDQDGTRRLTIQTGTGNVGIGTTNPSDLLQIGDGVASPGFTTNPDKAVTVGSTVNGEEVAYQLYSSELNNDIRSKFFIDDTTLWAGIDTTYGTGLQGFSIGLAGNRDFVVNTLGNVGIGTANPTSRLHVYQDVNSGAALNIQNPNAGTGAFSQMSVNAGSQSAWLYTFGNNYTTSGQYIQASSVLEASGSGGLSFSATGGPQRFYTNGSNERMRISSSGNVGIGTTNPAFKFVVSNAGNGGLEFAPDYSGSASAIQAYDRAASAYRRMDFIASNFRFAVGGSQSMEISTAGKVGIGVNADDSHQLYALNETNPTGNVQLRSGLFGEVDVDNNSYSSFQPIGVVGTVRYRGSASESASGKGARAFDGSTFIYNTGTTQYASGFRLDMRNLGTGTVSQMAGAWIPSFENSGGGAITNSYGIKVDNLAAGTNRYGVYSNQSTGFDFYAAGSAPNYFAGNVGIGTNAPDTKLDVNGATTFRDLARLGTGGSQGFLTWGGGAANTVNLLGTTGKAVSLGSNAVYDRFYLDTSGNVGIGTTAPAGKLDVTAGLGVYSYIGGAVLGHRSVRLGADGAGYATIQGTGRGAGAGGIGTNFDLTLQPEGGNIGIGTLTPGYKLDIVGSDYAHLRLQGGLPLIKFAGSAYNSGNGAELWQRGDGQIFLNLNSSTGAWVVNTSGNMGIGTVTPSTFKLEVGGNVGPSATNSYNLGAAGRNWGCLYYNGGTTGTCASDERLKDDIQSLSFATGSTTALDKLALLDLRSFEYNSAPGSKYNGLIAQEVRAAGLEALISEADDGYLAVRYGDLQWVVIEAMQDMWKRVQEYFDRTEALEEEVEDLKQRIEQLENQGGGSSSQTSGGSSSGSSGSGGSGSGSSGSGSSGGSGTTTPPVESTPGGEGTGSSTPPVESDPDPEPEPVEEIVEEPDPEPIPEPEESSPEPSGDETPTPTE